MKISLRLLSVGTPVVAIEIQATMMELGDFVAHNAPSHALAHRLTDAIHEMQQQLRTVIERTVEVEQ